VHGEAPELPFGELDLARVDSRADGDRALIQRLRQPGGTRHGSSWTVEGREEAVARMVDLAAAVGVEVLPHDVVVVPDELDPGRIAAFRSQACRADDVGEHDGGQLPVQNRQRLRSGQEFLDLVEQRSEVAGAERKGVRVRQLDVLRAGDVLREVST
jgi:hypothetical protein